MTIFYRSLSLLPSPLRLAMATVDTVAMATAKGATDMARGRLSPAMATGATDMAATAGAMVATGAMAMARGRLMLSPAMATGATDMAATATAGAMATEAT